MFSVSFIKSFYTSSPAKVLAFSMNRLMVGFVLLALTALSAQAAYVNEFSTTTRGAITFTGNTLGLSMNAAGTMAPGTDHSVGAFVTTNTALQYGTYPAGTTINWHLNSSAANLVLPAGSTVLHAELIWGGSYNVASGTGDDNVTSSLGTSVSFTPPGGSTIAVAPRSATPQFGASSDMSFSWYVQSADVTALVRTAGAGTYVTGGVPGTYTTAEPVANAAGWTLAVVYGNASLPTRNLTVFVGAEGSGTAGLPPAQVSGFCTPLTGPVNGRVLITAVEGDANNMPGDTFLFGPTMPLGVSNRLSGPNNPITNFFASQINNDAGTIDTTGTFGTRNHDASAGTAAIGGRQGWDITNVDGSAQLVNGQTQAFAQGTTSGIGDEYVVAGLGLQIDTFSPSFPIVVKTVNRSSTFVGDVMTYTVTLTNNGQTNADGVIFGDALIPETTFVPGSLRVDGVARPAVVAPTGVALGTINIGQTVTVDFQVTVNAMPAGGIIRNSASWTYNYTACSATLAGAITTNEVSIPFGAGPDLTITKSHVGNFTQGQIGATYTLTVGNSGGAPTSGTVTVTDTLPAGLTATAISGTGWSCVLGTLTCTRSDVLAPAGSYPPITVTVNVSGSAPASVTNTATVAGTGDSNPGNNTVSDPTTINGVTPPATPTTLPVDARWALALFGLLMLYTARRRLRS